MSTVQIPVKVPWTRQAWKKLLVTDVFADTVFIEFWADWEAALRHSSRFLQSLEDLLVSMILPGVPLDKCRDNPSYRSALNFMGNRPMTAESVEMMLGHLCLRSCEESDYFTSPLQWFEALTVACSFSESVIRTFSAEDRGSLGQVTEVLRCVSIGALILAVNAHFGLATGEMRRTRRLARKRKKESKCARKSEALAGELIPMLATQFGQWQCN